MQDGAPKTQPSRLKGITSGGIRGFFSNPMVGFVGSTASIISLGLAVYFYLDSRATRELRYFVNPARAVVVHVGQTSRLAVTLDGAPVKHDISAAQLAFWNEGRSAIKSDNILRQLVIRTSPSAPIIEATIRKRSREVVRIDLDKRQLALGELTVQWNILEFHDGGIIQIIYLGDVNTPVTATATIEGQGNLPKSHLERTPNFLLAAYLLAPLVCIADILLVYRVMRKNKFRLGVTALLILAMVYTLWFLGYYWMATKADLPPFGF